MIASVLVMTKNMTAQQAVALVREKRPTSVQTNAQVSCILVLSQHFPYYLRVPFPPFVWELATTPTPQDLGTPPAIFHRPLATLSGGAFQIWSRCRDMNGSSPPPLNHMSCDDVRWRSSQSLPTL